MSKVLEIPEGFIPDNSDSPEGFSVEIPDGFEPDAATAKSHGYSGSWQAPGIVQQAKDLAKSGLEKTKKILPSGRTAAQLVGTTVGGVAGAELGPAGVIAGGAYGSSVGESLYQLGQHLFTTDAPKSAQEAAHEQTKALISGGVGGAVPAAAEYHAEHPILSGLTRFLSKGFKTPAETFATRAVGTDPVMQKYIEKGLDELKAAEDIIGPIRDTFKARRALDLRSKGYNSTIADEIVKPQEGIIYPGSSKIMAENQIRAIPEDIRLNDVTKYAKLVEEIKASHPEDYTIGELNTLRSELAATQSPYYGKDVSGQMTMDAGIRAKDISRGNTSRELFYEGLDKYGLGGGKEARELNGRIGAIINWKDALSAKAGTTVAEHQTVQGKYIGVLTSPFKTTERAVKGTSKTTDENLALAIKRWDTRPKSVAPAISKKTPIGTTWKKPADTVQGSSRDPITGEILMPHGNIKKVSGGYTLDGKFYGTKPPTTVKGEQQPLQPTVIRPKVGASPSNPSVMGINQETPEAIPSGTKLAFKSKTLDGTDLWHYETPDGKFFTAKRELSPDIAKLKPEPKSKSGLTPPPRLRKKKLKL